MGEDCLREVEVVDKDYLIKVEVVAEGLFVGQSNLLPCAPLVRFRSSSLRLIFLSS